MHNNTNPTCKEIVEDWLRKNGYDGLWQDTEEGCGCGLDDLAPCGEVNMEDCRAGYKSAKGIGPRREDE